MGRNAAVDPAYERHRRSHSKDQLEPWRSVKPSALSAGGGARAGWPGRARYVPDRRSHRGQSRSLTVSAPGDPQVSQSAGNGATAPQTSQADYAGSIPVTRSMGSGPGQSRFQHMHPTWRQLLLILRAGTRTPGCPFSSSLPSGLPALDVRVGDACDDLVVRVHGVPPWVRLC